MTLARLSNVVHEVNAVGEPCVEDLDHLGTRVCRQIILGLVHLGFLLCFIPSPPGPGLARTLLVSRAWVQPVEPGLVMHASGTSRAVIVALLQSCPHAPTVRAPGRDTRTLQPAFRSPKSLLWRVAARLTERAFSVPTLDPACPLPPAGVPSRAVPPAAGEAGCGA